ncbi:MAG TPA: alpha/beta fold hydrolase [Solirubrobacteraceae bacterium]|nr:alpha/beta fold hydrolase [Solirubrobacteraceae bacterium]
MLRRILTLVLGAPLLSIVIAAVPATQAQALTFAPCSTSTPTGFTCATLTVPLARNGAAPGTVGLNIERLQASAVPTGSAVIGLAGGPGQAALPLAEGMAKEMAPALGSRDLLVFDQRGTGSSGPLTCAALESSAEVFGAIGQAFERCAQQIGATRGSYTTQESVADIEAIRQAAGYQKLVLFGVSYGTKVALEYAERYPQNVEALVLDSVVPPERDDPFSVAMLQAMKPVFEELCSAHACAGITANPLGDVARLAATLQKHALNGYIYDGSGHRHRASMSNVDLLNLIGAGDLNPALRALLPASVQSALHGDPAPLLRLNLLSEGLIPNLPGNPSASANRKQSAVAAGPTSKQDTKTTPAANTSHHRGTPLASSDGIDEALFVDTTCEEEPFPWQRSAPASTRLAEALNTLHTLPESDFYPFDASVAWADSILPGCAQWPNLAPPPPAIAPLPSVPTLILSGAQDLRTPTSGAQAIAARIPGAQLVVVPYTGHSVLGTDFSGCSQAAVTAFFSGGAVQPCPATQNPFPPTPITPTKLAFVKSVGGVPGRAGSTLAVALDTIVDLERQVIGATLQADEELPSGSSFGGLHGGFARITPSALQLHGLSFVNGVQLSGSFPVKDGHLQAANLRIEGSQAARGTIRIGASAHVSGTLGGRRFYVDLAKVKLARATQADRTPASWPAMRLSFPVPSLAQAR